jgi:hypothetical protein
MPQIAEDYEQVSARLGLPPGFIHAASTPSEHRRRCENLFKFLRDNRVPGNVLKTVKGPLDVIDAHEQSAKIGRIMPRYTRRNQPEKQERPRWLAAFSTVSTLNFRRSSADLKVGPTKEKRRSRTGV